MVAFCIYLKNCSDRNGKLSRVGTGSVANRENTETRLIESFVQQRRTSRIDINPRATYIEPNVDPPGVKIPELSMDYVQRIREELMEQNRKLRNDIQAQFEEIKNSHNINEEKQNSQ